MGEMDNTTKWYNFKRECGTLPFKEFQKTIGVLQFAHPC